MSKRLFMDCLGVALAASSEPVIQKLTGLLQAQGGIKEARVWGKSLFLPLLNAVIINGTMAHALDFDDSAFSHPSATILPVAISLGDKLHLSGRAVLGAILIGYEIFGTLSACTSQKLLREKGWHPTPILGTIAAAATAAKLLRLEDNEVCMALGIAASSAGGLGQNFGTMTKPLHAGFSARNGLLAAQLASEGITADDHILEGERGFANAFFGKEGHEIEKISQVLGHPYKVISPGINIKPYPCCRRAHKAIDAAIALRQELQIHEEEIKSVECDLHLDGPTLYLYPRTGLEGKFSIAYCVSIALLEGKVGLEEFSDQRFHDPVVQRLMKKVINLRKKEKGELVTVNLKDGRSFSHSVIVAKGDARNNPLSDKEVKEKFRACAKRVLSPQNILLAEEKISRMEELSNFRQFLDQIMGVI